jgi:hypothetical protein
MLIDQGASPSASLSLLNLAKMKGFTLAVLAIYASAVAGGNIIGPKGVLNIVNKNIAPDGFNRA